MQLTQQQIAGSHRDRFIVIPHCYPVESDDAIVIAQRRGQERELTVQGELN
jgi:hypothetical protein